MISDKVVKSMNNSSWIRKMFQEGEELRRMYGASKVFDFSLGNPETDPPIKLKNTLKKLVNTDIYGLHRYMHNAGFLDVREKIADFINGKTNAGLTSNNVIMTCGAAGGINTILKTILNEDDEVIIFTPYFSEYIFYVENFGGKCIFVQSDLETFQPNLHILEKSISHRTKAIIINTPNNPTGVVYSQETLIRMSSIIEKKQNEYNSTIFVISDEPYAEILYDNIIFPSVLSIFKNCLVVNSFSKSLAIPGERIGYIAVSNKIDEIDLLLKGLIFSNRILGFINAPALFQKVIADSLDEPIDTCDYKKKRDLFYNALTDIGFSCVKPQGTFYLFPKSPIEDDLIFVKKALKYNILVVPGTGFGCPGHFRISYCVNIDTIKNSIDAFKRLYDECVCDTAYSQA